MKTIRPLLAAAICLSLGGLNASAVTSKDYTNGLQQYQQKNYHAAAASFEAAMHANPRDANCVYYCALSNQLSNNRARARQLYEYAITAFPGSQVAQMAQQGLAQLGGGAPPAGGSGAIGTTSSGSGNVGSANADTSYLARLPDEINIPLIRKGTNPTAVYVEVAVNGRPIVFHLDTGAYSTVIGANTLEDVGLGRPNSGDQFEITGVGSREHIKAWHQNIDLKLGPVYRRDFQATVEDHFEGEPLLGQDFLRDFILTIDGGAGQVQLRKKTAKVRTARGTIDIPFKLGQDGRHLIVEGTVNGKRCPFIFDTGASSVVFGFEHCKKLGIPLPEGPPTGISEGVAGQTNTWLITLDSLKLGPIEREGFRASIVESEKMGMPLLGQSFFGRYKITVDQSAHLIHMVDQD